MARAYAAALTPLRDGGAAPAQEVFGAYHPVLREGGGRGHLAPGAGGGKAEGKAAAGVAVMGPPYFALDDRALLDHFTTAARACEPLPFYVYEFRARAGYSVPLPVLAQLRERASNLKGLKVSNRPF